MIIPAPNVARRSKVRSARPCSGTSRSQSSVHDRAGRHRTGSGFVQCTAWSRVTVARSAGLTISRALQHLPVLLVQFPDGVPSLAAVRHGKTLRDQQLAERPAAGEMEVRHCPPELAPRIERGADDGLASLRQQLLDPRRRRLAESLLPLVPGARLRCIDPEQTEALLDPDLEAEIDSRNRRCLRPRPGSSRSPSSASACHDPTSAQPASSAPMTGASIRSITAGHSQRSGRSRGMGLERSSGQPHRRYPRPVRLSAHSRASRMAASRASTSLRSTCSPWTAEFLIRTARTHCRPGLGRHLESAHGTHQFGRAAIGDGFGGERSGHFHDRLLELDASDAPGEHNLIAFRSPEPSGQQGFGECGHRHRAEQRFSEIANANLAAMSGRPRTSESTVGIRERCPGANRFSSVRRR